MTSQRLDTAGRRKSYSIARLFTGLANTTLFQ